MPSLPPMLFLILYSEDHLPTQLDHTAIIKYDFGMKESIKVTL